MRRRVQELEDAADPSLLYADVLIRLLDRTRVERSPYESNRPCNLVGLHRLWPFATTHRDSQSDRAPVLHTRQPLA